MSSTFPNRRALMAGGLAAAAAPAFAAVAAPDPLAGMLVVDSLAGLTDPLAEPLPGEKPPETIVDNRPHLVTERSIGHSRNAGVSALVVTIGHVSGPAEPFEHTVADIGRFDRIVRDHPAQLIKVHTAADMLRARQEGKIGVVYATQNSLMLGDRAERVEVFADLGIRQFQLTYNLANTIGDGSMAPANRGLTPFGREVVERLNARRLIIDLSHSGERTCLDAIAASKGPIVISHSGCRALGDSPRNKSDAELRGVAEKGGYFGVYFMPFLTPGRQPAGEDVVRHIEHALNICGEDFVGIGTDGGHGPVDFDAMRKVQAEYVQLRRSQGIAATGELADILFLVPDLTGPAMFRKLAGLLKARGHSTARIEKVLGGNYVRAAREIWGG